MSHPFFDAQQFPWHRDDAKRLHQALATAIVEPRDISLRYQQAGQHLTPLAGGNSEQVWAQVLDNLVLSGVLKTFCDQLLQDQRIAAIHTTIRTVVNANDHATIAPTNVSPNRVTVTMDLDRDHFNQLAQRSFVRELAACWGLLPNGSQ